MKYLILFLLSACTPYICPPVTVTHQTDEAIRLRAQNAQLNAILGQCIKSYNEIHLKCPQL